MEKKRPLGNHDEKIASMNALIIKQNDTMESQTGEVSSLQEEARFQSPEPEQYF